MTKTFNNGKGALVATLITLAAVMGACGDNDSETGSDPAGTGGTGSGGGATTGGNVSGSGLDCDVLTPAFIENLFKTSAPVQDAQADGSYRRATSACEWNKPAAVDTDTNFWNVEVSLYASGRLEQQVNAFGGTEIAGLGDRAVYVESASNSLLVAVGDIDFEIFMQRGSKPATNIGRVTDAQEIEAMKSVATEALNNL